LKPQRSNQPIRPPELGCPQGIARISQHRRRTRAGATPGVEAFWRSEPPLNARIGEMGSPAAFWRSLSAKKGLLWSCRLARTSRCRQRCGLHFFGNLRACGCWGDVLALGASPGCSGDAVAFLVAQDIGGVDVGSALKSMLCFARLRKRLTRPTQNRETSSSATRCRADASGTAWRTFLNLTDARRDDRLRRRGWRRIPETCLIA